MGRRIPYKDSKKHFKTIFLTDEQVESIVKEYPFFLTKELIEKYSVSKSLINDIARHYSLKKDTDTYRKARGWKINDEPVDLIMFEWFYPKTTDKQMQKVFGKSEHFLRALAIKRNLKKYDDVLSSRHSKSKPRIGYDVSGIHYESDFLSLEDIKYVIENYAVEANKFLAEKLNCEENHIVSISNYYKLTKDKEILKIRRKEILVHRNKNITGRDLTPEVIKEIALKYYSKREFCDKDSSAYITANRLGIMEEVTKHMVNMSFSVPQIISRQITEYLFNQKCEYNTRRIIAPYELDVYFPNLKIAFEYDGKGWHQNDEIDKTKLCKDKGILLIKLFERSRRFKEDIQQHLVENLQLINKWCNLFITEENILSFSEPIDFPKLFTDEELYILRNNDTSYLRKNHNNLYQKYQRYNPDNKVFTTLKWTEDVVKDELSKYENWKDVYQNNRQLYQAVMKKFKHLKLSK